MQTTGANVTSLATDSNLGTLYAADGDSSIEVFNITVPSSSLHTGTLSSLPRVLSVKTTATRLYASDGVSTDIFINGTKAATVSKPTLTLATVTGDVIFAAGNDRHIRAADWTTLATPVELFGTDIIPTGGTINRVGAMAIAGGRLYVAGGDSGLLTFDVSSMATPFPIRSYADTPMTSTFWVDGKLYASRSGGGLAEYVKSSNGYLTAARQWDARTHTVYDGANGFLLHFLRRLYLLLGSQFHHAGPRRLGHAARECRVGGGGQRHRIRRPLRQQRLERRPRGRRRPLHNRSRTRRRPRSRTRER